MITNATNPVEWATFVTELDDAHEHLASLLGELVKCGEVDEEDLRVQLGHIYAHLNRAWHVRHHRGEVSSSEWEQFSQFPNDVPWT